MRWCAQKPHFILLEKPQIGILSNSRRKISVNIFRIKHRLQGYIPNFIWYSFFTQKCNITFFILKNWNKTIFELQNGLK